MKEKNIYAKKTPTLFGKTFFDFQEIVSKNGYFEAFNDLFIKMKQSSNKENELSQKQYYKVFLKN